MSKFLSIIYTSTVNDEIPWVPELFVNLYVVPENVSDVRAKPENVTKDGVGMFDIGKYYLSLHWQDWKQIIKWYWINHWMRNFQCWKNRQIEEPMYIFGGCFFSPMPRNPCEMIGFTTSSLHFKIKSLQPHHCCG